MIERLIYIIIAILILALMFRILQRHLRKIGYKDFNKFLLNNKNTVKDKHFVNEKTGSAYMLNTYNGNLFYCTKITNAHTTAQIKQKHDSYVANCNPDDFIKISDNYYKIISENIYFDIETLLNDIKSK